MRRIYPPTDGGEQPADCVEAIEPALAQLLDRAEEAGWQRDEALRAICVLVWRMIEPETGPSAEAA